MTITDYQVVREHDLSTLVEGVNQLLGKGYEPLGGIQVAAPVISDGQVAPIFLQSMIKRVKA